MKTFKNISDGRTIIAFYEGRILVYLESNDDVQVWQRWFPNVGETLKFVSANENGTGGCSGVIQQVKMDRDKGLNAHGIVDRDILLTEKHVDIFFSRDERRSSGLFGKAIFIVRCWEMENYLLDPMAIEVILADKYGRKERDDQEIFQEMKDFIATDGIIPLMAANLFLKTHNQSEVAPLFEKESSDGTNIYEKLIEHLLKKCTSNFSRENITQSFEGYIKEVNTMIEGCAAKELFCLLDGKMFLNRFFRQHTLKEEQRFRLARWIKEHDHIHPELIEHIRQLCQITTSPPTLSPPAKSR